MLANKIMGATSAAPDLNYIEDVFSTYLYTGNGANPAINNGIDLAGEGGLVWIKGRAGPDPFGYERHVLHDSQRGVGFRLSSNLTNAQASEPQDILSFNANGFTLGGGGRANDPATTYASWTFRKQPKFFDVVTYTGTGAAQTISHSLDATVGMLIIKKTSATGNWVTFARVSGAAGSTNYAYFSCTGGLNSTAAADVGSAGAEAAGNITTTAFKPSELSCSGDGGLFDINASGQTYVAYLFAHDAGGFGLSGNENVVSCGSYTGNGSASGPTVNLGYEPQWVLIKGAVGDDYNWMLFDTMRGLPTGGEDARLFANASSTENSGTDYLNVNATGFQITGNWQGTNTGGATYIYIAIRRGPMKVPELGTSVFDAQFEGNVPDSQKPFTRSTTGVVDMAMRSYRPGGVWNGSQVWSRLQDANYFNGTASTDIEVAGTAGSWAFMNGWLNSVATSTITSQLDYMFRRAPNFFDVVCDTGTGVAKTVSHNLSVAPELIIRKNRNGTLRNWTVACTYLPNGFSDYLFLSLNGNVGTNTTYWNATAPTTSVFSVGTNITNTASVNYVTYLFATCPGVSKVGSYTGTGTTQAIACGFTAGARFVMIKRTDLESDWYVWDTARGIVAGNDPYLALNTTAAEVTGTDYIDPSSAGFEISSTAPAAINASGGSYIFLAIA